MIDTIAVMLIEANEALLSSPKTWAIVGLVFIMAGFVKGVVGMGLPTVAMGLLSVVMVPAQAAAILIIPSFVTNLWQLLAGPSFRALLSRLWAMMIGVAAGTIATGSMLTSGANGLALPALGIALIIYAVLGLAQFRFQVSRANERWMSPAVGLLTGLVTGATGVFVIPAVPYLQALNLEKEDLIQALGLSFTVSTIALAIALLGGPGQQASSVALIGGSLMALIPAIAGMFLGQWLRSKMSVPTFRQVFFVGLLMLGLYLAAEAIM